MPTFDPSQPYDVISEPRVTRGSIFGDQNGPGTDAGDNGQFAYGGSSVNNPEDYAALPVGSGVPPGYQFPVLNPATGDVTWVTHRDKGPAQWTGRGVDLAPSAMAKLHAQTDDPLVVDTAKAVPPFDPSKPYQVVNAQAQQQSIPSPTLSQEVGPPQAPPAATDARTQHLIDSSHIGSQRDLEDIAASLPGYRQSQEAASQNDTRDKVTAALGNNLSPIVNHPLQSAYGMLVPTKENTLDPLAQMFTNPSKAFSRDVPIGSQEWYNELIANLSLVLPGAAEHLGAKLPEAAAEAPKPDLTPAGEHASTPNEQLPSATVLRPENEPPPSTGAESSPAPGLLQDEGATERPNAATAGESTSVAGQEEPGAGAQAGSPPDSESLGVTGVSRAARDAAGEVDRTPATVLSVEDHVQNGQRLEAQGANPDLVVRDAVTQGSFSRDATDLAIKRDADLTKAARQARRAADQAPGDRGLSLAADTAEKAQQQWEDYAIRPIRGQFQQTGMSLQTAIDLDTGDYVDYRKQFAKQNGREPTPVEADQLKGATRTARKLSEANSADLSRIEKAAKPKRIMNRDELRDSLSKTKAQALADCLV